MEIYQKAYKLRLSYISEGYLYDEISVNSYSKGKAKSHLLKSVHENDMELKSGEEITFLNIPVERDKKNDTYIFEGSIKKKRIIDYILAVRAHKKQIESILKKNIDGYCYIKKRGSYYGSGYCGYTSSISSAGIYTTEEACSHCYNYIDLSVEPIDVDKHNEAIENKIEKLKNKIITLGN